MYDSTYSAEKREHLRKIYNNKDNKDGKYIKIIIGSPIISEGITLKNTRQVHILEPSWNMSKINQIIGRAVRNYSHNDLEKEYRDVQIYKYTSVPYKNSKLQSIDKQKYILSEYKDRSNKEVERLLKQIAFDCNLKVSDENLVPGSAECDYTSCDYQCEISTKKTLPRDKSTYLMYLDFFDKYDIEYTTNFIKEMFKIYFVWSIDDILQKLHEKTEGNISNESVFSALSSLVKNKVLLSDLYGRDGFLIQKDMYIIFNPIDKDMHTSIFAKVLDFESDVNKYTLSDYMQAIFKNTQSKTTSKKEKKKKVTAEISDTDQKYNDKITKSSLLYGHYRDKGLNGNFGEIDGKFRIVDLRSFKEQDDKRKNITGMAISSKKKEQLLDIISYLKITPKLVKDNQYIGYNGNIVFKELNTKQLSQIIQKDLEKKKLILR
jgi:hypothetical protein